MTRPLLIEAITPSVDCGRYPAKRTAGEECVVEADAFRHGHEQIRVALRWRPKGERREREAPMEPLGNDRWRGRFPLEANARYLFRVVAWTDSWASWVFDFARWVRAGKTELAAEVAEGVGILQRTLRRLKQRSEDARFLRDAALRLSGAMDDPHTALMVAQEAGLDEAMVRAQPRKDQVASSPPLEVVADRPLARFGAWYEMFPRSQGPTAERSATFLEAAEALVRIRDLGFDVVYLPPIHPIGRTGRKGPGNTLTAGPGDPGSPWAIGGPEGGHTAVEPGLGTIEDFDAFVARARELGLEVALDFAIQCSPDHPWVREHPQWFARRRDGSIRYAENPPKRYQDIYPVNFETRDRRRLWETLRDVVLFWVGHGVRLFRVDNPHTKPVPFWEWLIAEIQKHHPDVIFLSEAFTRPKMMKALAKAGFTQSYTYFTWRNTKAELTEYLTELTTSGMEDYFRPNFFANTPDILTEVLQKGGRPAFKMRLVLAATLSPTYGIYSGFELCENEALPGTEEYLSSEKYQIKTRDWNRPGNINEFVAKVNHIRRTNPALHHLVNLRFLPTDNDQILAYCKATEDHSNVLLVAVNLDPFNPHHCTVHVPPALVGVAPGRRYGVRDLLTGAVHDWAEDNYVRLVPREEPAHVFLVERRGP